MPRAVFSRLVSCLLLVGCASPASPPTPTDAPSAPVSSDARFDPPYVPVPDGVGEPPKFKPSSKSKAPVPITTDAYGAFTAAPDAPALGQIAADFTVPLASGGQFALAKARAAGPVLLMFYRGFW